MAVTVDLVPDGDASPAITRVKENATAKERAEYMAWFTHYFKGLFDHAKLRGGD